MALLSRAALTKGPGLSRPLFTQCDQLQGSNSIKAFSVHILLLPKRSSHGSFVCSMQILAPVSRQSKQRLPVRPSSKPRNQLFPALFPCQLFASPSAAGNLPSNFQFPPLPTLSHSWPLEREENEENFGGLNFNPSFPVLSGASKLFLRVDSGKNTVYGRS